MPFPNIFHKTSKHKPNQPLIKSLHNGSPHSQHTKLLNIVDPSPRIVQVSKSSPSLVPDEFKKSKIDDRSNYQFNPELNIDMNDRKINKVKSNGFLGKFIRRGTKYTSKYECPSESNSINNSHSFSDCEDYSHIDSAGYESNFEIANNNGINHDNYNNLDIIDKVLSDYEQIEPANKSNLSSSMYDGGNPASAPPSRHIYKTGLDDNILPLSHNIIIDHKLNQEFHSVDESIILPELNDLPHSTEVDIEFEVLNGSDNNQQPDKNNRVESMITHFHYSKKFDNNSILDDLSSLLQPELEDENENQTFESAILVESHKDVPFSSPQCLSDVNNSSIHSKEENDTPISLTNHSIDSSRSNRFRRSNNGAPISSSNFNADYNDPGSFTTPTHSIKQNRSTLKSISDVKSKMDSNSYVDNFSNSTFTQQSIDFDQNTDTNNMTCTNSNNLSNSNIVDKYIEFETFKDVDIQIIKNYNHHSDSKLKIVSSSPAKSTESDVQDSPLTLKNIQQNHLLTPNLNNENMEKGLDDLDPFNYSLSSVPINSIPKDEVYREEMLSLISRHSLMVNKKQEEINQLKQLLEHERKINMYLSSPQQRVESSQIDSPKSNSSNFENHNVECKKVFRKKFLPINITITDDSKLSHPYPYNSDNLHLLPPFKVNMTPDYQTFKSPISTMVNSINANNDENFNNNILSESNYFNPANDKVEFRLKPFHKFKGNTHKLSKMNLEVTETSEENISNESIHELPLFPNLKYHSLSTNRSSINSKHSSIGSMTSSTSTYYTALENNFHLDDSAQQAGSNVLNPNSSCFNDVEDSNLESEETIPNSLLKKNMNRNFSSSTTVSSVMSNVQNDTDDFIFNSSFSSVATPDSMEYKIDKKYV